MVVQRANRVKHMHNSVKLLRCNDSWDMLLYVEGLTGKYICLRQIVLSVMELRFEIFCHFYTAKT